jgi:heterodisulfide reductase subunit B2
VKTDPVARDRMNAFMYDEPVDYQGDVDVVHLLEVLREQKSGLAAMSSKVAKPLKGLRVASYYGCMLVRPRSIAIDDVEDPVLLDELVEVLGGKAVDFSHKTECCGAYQTVNRPEIVADRTHQILEAARGQGANIVAVSCPLCAFNLDHRQAMTQKMHSDFEPMPIVYFTQLMAIAFGCTEAALRFDLHHVSPRPVLAELGLV